VLLYLVRHGEARSAQEDPERPLSDLGVAQVRRVARTLAGLRPDVQVIWHSGKRRAEQTAELLAEALAKAAAEVSGRRIKPEARPHLEPGDSPKSVLRLLRGEERNLLLVGHLPYLSRLATALLLRSDAPEAPLFLDLQAASVACLERTAEDWALKWLLTPELCP